LADQGRELNEEEYTRLKKYLDQAEATEKDIEKRGADSFALFIEHCEDPTAPNISPKDIINP